MTCPRCDKSVLEERERDGVVIDACPRCRGIWLDRGELEKLIARAAADFNDDQQVDPRRAEARGWGGDDDDDDDDRRRAARGRSGQPGGRKRRWYESFGDLFD